MDVIRHVTKENQPTEVQSGAMLAAGSSLYSGYNIKSAGVCVLLFFFSSRRRHTRLQGDWSSDVCSSDLFHRAFNHFNAVRVWGSVPLMMRPTSEFATATQITRAPIAEIYDSIARDLEDAADRKSVV